MAAETVDYADKEQGEASQLPTNKVWSFGNANEVKEAVNDHAARIDINTDDILANALAISGTPLLSNRVIVTQANVNDTLGGVIDSTKQYFIDGHIDMGSTSITVPVGGITLKGYSFDVSSITSTSDTHTLFISESIAIGSGNVLGTDFTITTSGAGSKVYELYAATGFEAIELQRVNYIDCTSLGDLYEYRQGLEDGTGRFGGSPSLTLHGIWLGGFLVTNSIVRNLAGTMTEPIFKEGTLFQMNSRFKTNINCDLPTLAPLLDFSSINFPNPSTLQLQGCEITRDGVYDADDVNLTPNTTSGSLSSDWRNNNGLNNTQVGGRVFITAETETSIAVTDTYYPVAGTWTALDLQHFDSPANGQLRHLGNSPRDFELICVAVLDGQPNSEYTMKFRKWDDSASAFSEIDYTSQTRVINNLQGGRDVAYYTMITGTTLDTNDYIYMEVKNITGTDNATMELDSYYIVKER
jgi:hypothetical protein